MLSDHLNAVSITKIWNYKFVVRSASMNLHFFISTNKGNHSAECLKIPNQES